MLPCLYKHQDWVLQLLFGEVYGRRSVIRDTVDGWMVILTQLSNLGNSLFYMACKLFSALGQSTEHLPAKLLGYDNEAAVQNEWCAGLCLMKCRDITSLQQRIL